MILVLAVAVIYRLLLSSGVDDRCLQDGRATTEWYRFGVFPHSEQLGMATWYQRTAWEGTETLQLL